MRDRLKYPLKILTDYNIPLSIKEQTVKNTLFSGYASRKAQPINSLGVYAVHDATKRLLKF